MDQGFGTVEDRNSRLHNEDVSHIIAAEAEFAGLFDPKETDTLIWLRVLSLSKRPRMTCTGAVYPTNWLLPYSSAALRSSGFSKFAQLLDDERYQAKMHRALQKSGFVVPAWPNPMMEPRYVLDLGASTDDTLRSEHLHALTLPEGIVRYSMMTQLAPGSAAPTSLAGGHDDACRCFRDALRGVRGVAVNIAQARAASASHGSPLASRNDSPSVSLYQEGPDDPMSDRSASHVGHTNAPGELDKPDKSSQYLTGSIWDLEMMPPFCIDDYCEIRHVANVIRLLLAISGPRRTLLLNSAARVYTLAGLAKLFGLRAAGAGDAADDDADGAGQGPFDPRSSIVANRIRSCMTEWFLIGNNARIIDILPEECFIIAWNLQLQTIARVAFRILVAERALFDAGTDDNLQPRRSQSRQTMVFGRKLSGWLNDDMESLVENASECLIRRALEARQAYDSWATTISDSDRGRDRDTSQIYRTLNAITSIPEPVARRESLIRLLLDLLEILEYLRPMEQEIAQRTSTLAQGDDAACLAITEAVSALRLLLLKLEQAIKYRIPSKIRSDDDTIPELLQAKVSECLSLYVPHANRANKAWPEVYGQLAQTKRYLTSLPWDKHREDVTNWLDQRVMRLFTGNLLEVFSQKISEVLTCYIYEPHTVVDDALRDEARDALREEVQRRFEALSVPLSNIPVTISVHDKLLHGTNLTLFNDLCYHVTALDAGLKGSSRDIPEFELGMLEPSPHLLLSLSTDEFRFLPLWAGGHNDVAGPMYEPVPPTAYLGPTGPGPEYHTGLTNTSGSNMDLDGSTSMMAPPSLSDNADRAGPLANDVMSDIGAEQENTVGNNFVMVQHLSRLDLTGDRPASMSNAASLTNTATDMSSGFSSHASQQVNDSHSAVSGTLENISMPNVSSLSSSVVVVDMAMVHSNDLTGGNMDRSANCRGTPISNADFGMWFDDEFDDDEVDNDDEFGNEEEFDNDDDNADARSDDTVVPDRVEIEHAMHEEGSVWDEGE